MERDRSSSCGADTRYVVGRPQEKEGQNLVKNGDGDIQKKSLIKWSAADFLFFSLGACHEKFQFRVSISLKLIFFHENKSDFIFSWGLESPAAVSAYVSDAGARSAQSCRHSLPLGSCGGSLFHFMNI